MKKKFKINNINTVALTESELNNDEYLSVIEKNRERIRSLASILLNINGFILSALLVIIFFFIKEYNFTNVISKVIFGGYFLSIIFVVCSFILIVLSIYVYPATPISTKAEMVNLQLEIFSRERKRLNASFWFLGASITSLLISAAITGICLT